MLCLFWGGVCEEGCGGGVTTGWNGLGAEWGAVGYGRLRGEGCLDGWMDGGRELSCGVGMEEVRGLDSPVHGPDVQGAEPELRASYAYNM